MARLAWIIVVAEWAGLNFSGPINVVGLVRVSRLTEAHDQTDRKKIGYLEFKTEFVIGFSVSRSGLGLGFSVFMPTLNDRWIDRTLDPSRHDSLRPSLACEKNIFFRPSTCQVVVFFVPQNSESNTFSPSVHPKRYG